MKLRVSVLSVLALVAISTLIVLPTAGADGPMTGELICLDPGHGGSDPGAVNETYGLWESEINLDVAFALKALLEGDGAAVVMTREDNDTYLENRDRYTFCNDQLATLLVSVHTNSVTDPTWDGTMTLYFQSDDKILAQAIHEVLYPALRATAPDETAFDDWGLSRYASGVLMKSNMPAAIMEPLFMSNPAEATLLQQTITDDCGDLSCRRGQIAQAVHMGILNYYGVTEPTPTPTSEPTPPPDPTSTPEPERPMYVDAMRMWADQKGPNTFIYTEVTIHDEYGEAVPGAVVALELKQPDGSILSNTGTTVEDGTVTVTAKLRSAPSGEYTSTITGVSKDGWAYDAPEEPIIASITVP
jgi:N-acetylmuramoyl-L-alanine amidase